MKCQNLSFLYADSPAASGKGNPGRLLHTILTEPFPEKPDRLVQVSQNLQNGSLHTSHFWHFPKQSQFPFNVDNVSTSHQFPNGLCSPPGFTAAGFEFCIQMWPKSPCSHSCLLLWLSPEVLCWRGTVDNSRSPGDGWLGARRTSAAASSPPWVPSLGLLVPFFFFLCFPYDQIHRREIGPWCFVEGRFWGVHLN